MNSLRQFEFVIEIAGCESISKAAKNLKISQPTLSKYIANLEQKLGVELFDRKTVPISLTEAGEKFVRAGKQILDVYSQLDRDFLKIKENATDVVRVGISPTRAHYILPALVREFKKLNSSAKLVIKERTTSQLNSELLRGELDLIISLRYDGTSEFEEVPLFSEKVMLAVPKKCAGLDALSVLRTCPFISTGAGLKMSDVLLGVLSEAGGSEPIIEVQSIESVLSLVNEGVGAALAPSYISECGAYDNIVFMELPKLMKNRFATKLDREVCVFFRKNQMLSDSEEDFVQACKNVVT
ncbi:MAG: LysR family transcriptional regulator [Oscillospiraceae bacterium]|nr:LysR family transcriptional regulator [Oscillospiraceae bacterium]